MSTDGVLRRLCSATFSGGRWLAPLLVISGPVELVRLLLWSAGIGLGFWLVVRTFKKTEDLARIDPG